MVSRLTIWQIIVKLNLFSGIDFDLFQVDTILPGEGRQKFWITLYITYYTKLSRSDLDEIVITSASSFFRRWILPPRVQQYLKFRVFFFSCVAAKRARLLLLRCSFTYTSLFRNLYCLFSSLFLAFRIMSFVLRLMKRTTAMLVIEALQGYK